MSYFSVTTHSTSCTCRRRSFIPSITLGSILKTDIQHYIDKPLVKYIEPSHCVEGEITAHTRSRHTIQVRVLLCCYHLNKQHKSFKNEDSINNKLSKDGYPSQKQAVVLQRSTLGGGGDIQEEKILCLQDCFSSLAEIIRWHILPLNNNYDDISFSMGVN